jgi:glycosyltransferase involved in cell wall biosynthesis
MQKSLLHAAIVIDSWFPGNKRIGTVGGGQIHVKQLTARMSQKYPVSFTLFFPAYDNFFYRLCWPVIVYTRLRQTHKKHPFSLIHAHGAVSSLVANMVGSSLNLPTIQTVHGTHLMDLHRKTPKTWLQRLASTNKKFTAVISVSNSFKKYPNINKNIHIIRNGVDVAEFDAVSVEKTADPTIIWVGSNDPSKGINVLRQGIAKVRKKIPSLQARLITGGALTGKALVKAYKQSHLFVLPSLAEGQPITLLEAWAAKLPVVATSVGDNPEMVKNGVNGYLVDPGNAVQLAEAIHKVLRARNKDVKMGEAGYQMVKKDYTWDKTTDATWKVYQQVTSPSL